MKDKKDIFKEFEDGIILLPQEQPEQVQEPTETENLFEKLHRFKNRKIFCDLDIAEFKKWKIINKIISIMIILLVTVVLMTIASCCSVKEATRCNLVASPKSTEPAHLGYKFTDELVAQIENDNIDLYEVYIVEDNKRARIENKYGFPVKSVCIIDANYIKYSDEYIRTMFSPEYIKQHDDNWGYWEYTLDYCE